jgi:ribosomal protein L12E/L44/L45/RPP1/RPP2
VDLVEAILHTMKIVGIRQFGQQGHKEADDRARQKRKKEEEEEEEEEEKKKSSIFDR